MTRILLCVALVGMCVLSAAPASACTCVQMTDAEAFERADVVFEGTVVEKREPRRVRSSLDPALWVFEVDAVHKGDAAERQGVYSAVSGASCGLELGPPGTEVVVFASRDRPAIGPALPRGALHAGLCDGSRSLADRPLPASLTDPSSPADGESGLGSVDGVGRSWIIAAALALGLVAASTVVVVRRRRLRALGLH